MAEVVRRSSVLMAQAVHGRVRRNNVLGNSLGEETWQARRGPRGSRVCVCAFLAVFGLFFRVPTRANVPSWLLHFAIDWESMIGQQFEN